MFQRLLKKWFWIFFVSIRIRGFQSKPDSTNNFEWSSRRLPVGEQRWRIQVNFRSHSQFVFFNVCSFDHGIAHMSRHCGERGQWFCGNITQAIVLKSVTMAGSNWRQKLQAYGIEDKSLICLTNIRAGTLQHILSFDFCTEGYISA